MPKQPARERDDSNSNRSVRTPEEWPVHLLRRNPYQDSNFHPLSDEEFREFADDMQRNGQQVPIEVLPDGRIVDGHQRLRAGEHLGWSSVKVVVRHDLAGDEGAIERRLIEANLHR